MASWQVPDQWTFLTEIPKPSVGTFDKKQLRSRCANDQPYD
jgi:fatty-acyl-CoA synthase